MCVLSTLCGNVDKHSPFDFIYIYIYIYISLERWGSLAFTLNNVLSWYSNYIYVENQVLQRTKASADTIYVYTTMVNCFHHDKTKITMWHCKPLASPITAMKLVTSTIWCIMEWVKGLGWNFMVCLLCSLWSVCSKNMPRFQNSFEVRTELKEKVWPFKFKVKIMSVVKDRGYKNCPIYNKFTSFLFSDTLFLRYGCKWVLSWKHIQNSRKIGATFF